MIPEPSNQRDVRKEKEKAVRWRSEKILPPNRSPFAFSFHCKVKLANTGEYLLTGQLRRLLEQVFFVPLPNSIAKDDGEWNFDYRALFF